MNVKISKHILVVWESSGDEIHLAVLESSWLEKIEKLIDSYIIDKNYRVEARLMRLVNKNTIIKYLCQSYVIENSEKLASFNITKIIHLPLMAF